MLEWTDLSELHECGWDTPELVKERVTINQLIRDIHTEREAIDEALRVIQETPVEELEVEQIDAARAVQKQRFKLLQREQSLRKGEISEHLSKISEEAQKANTAHAPALAKAEKDVQKRLESIGYLNPEALPAFEKPGAWTVDMVRNHSIVLATRQRERELLSAINGGYGYSNSPGLDQLQNQLEAARTKLLAVSM